MSDERQLTDEDREKIQRLLESGSLENINLALSLIEETANTDDIARFFTKDVILELICLGDSLRQAGGSVAHRKWLFCNGRTSCGMKSDSLSPAPRLNGMGRGSGLYRYFVNCAPSSTKPIKWPLKAVHGSYPCWKARERRTWVPPSGRSFDVQALTSGPNRSRTSGLRCRPSWSNGCPRTWCASGWAIRRELPTSTTLRSRKITSRWPLPEWGKVRMKTGD